MFFGQTSEITNLEMGLAAAKKQHDECLRGEGLRTGCGLIGTKIHDFERKIKEAKERAAMPKAQPATPWFKNPSIILPVALVAAAAGYFFFTR